MRFIFVSASLKEAVRATQESESSLRAELDEALRREKVKAGKLDQKYSSVMR